MSLFKTLIFVLLLVPSAFAQPDTVSSPPSRLYNDGTQNLQAGKLQEAETSLESAVASQNEKVQGPALYNLGCARFQDGMAELKKSAPYKQAADAEVPRADQMADDAIQAADKALSSDDLGEMLEAYHQGQGARKELKAATEAIKQAMETHGEVLAKWQRSAGDFDSAHELSPPDDDARFNERVVDHYIARLIDTMRMMFQGQQGMAQKREELRKRMQRLKKRLEGMPGQQFKGGEDDDDDEEPPKEPKPGEKELKQKEGKQVTMTPEEATRLLGMLKLDGDRKLPYGMGDTGQPQKRTGRDW